MSFTINNVEQSADRLQGLQNSVSEKQKKTQEEVAVQQETAYAAVSCEGDTLSISEAGKAAGTQPDNQTETDGVVIQKAAEEYLTESESGNSTINLSGYTENELKEMYLDGEITKAEYDEEIDSRETEVN